MGKAKRKPLLSICIPTYNRAPFLDEAIESVISQITDDIKDLVELCISDNASEDNTEDIINKWKTISPIPIVYHRNERNMGYDYNALKVVEMANGEYCWYLGDDDKLTKGAIRIVLDKISQYQKPDILLVRNVIIMDKSMTIALKKLDALSEKYSKEIVNSFKRDELLEYLRNSKHLNALFSYMSALIFKKENWKEDYYTKEIIVEHFIHAYQLFKIFLNGCRMVIIKEPIVLNRSGNDSLAYLGLLKRIYIDYAAFTKIAYILLKNDPQLYENYLMVLKKSPDHNFRRLLLICVNKSSSIDVYKDIENYLFEVGWEKHEIRLACLLGYFYKIYLKIKPMIKPIYVRLRALYRKIRPIQLQYAG